MPVTLHAKLVAHESRVWYFAWHPTQPSKFVSCGEDGCYLWTYPWKKAKAIDVKDVHPRTLRHVAWSPCGTYISMACFDATASIWRLESDDELTHITTIYGHDSEVKCTAWNHTGTLLATCSRDKSIWIHDVTDLENIDCISVLQGHAGDVKSVHWHPTHADMLFSCSYDNSIKVWCRQGDDFECLHTIRDHDSTVWTLCFDPSGSDSFVTCSADKTIRLWRRRSAMSIRLWFVAQHLRPSGGTGPWVVEKVIANEHARPVYSVSWHGDLIATACGDNQLRIFNTKDNWSCSTIPAHTSDLNHVAFVVNGDASSPRNLIATCGDDAMIKLWRYDSEPEQK
eukprot:GEMP01045583.1.p1 GENE.GEMP01045583.1~~GEMP01045583.1.p1  ORF type:complete len:351 (+),score=46.65 GEMP01045583.1:34-1053(+)